MDDQLKDHKRDSTLTPSASEAIDAPFEIIDLQSFLSPNSRSPTSNIQSNDPEGPLNEWPISSCGRFSLCPPSHFQFDEDRLYSSYLSGAISFDELMKELHTKTKLPGSKRKIRKRRSPQTRVRKPALNADELEDPSYYPGKGKFTVCFKAVLLYIQAQSELIIS